MDAAARLSSSSSLGRRYESVEETKNSTDIVQETKGSLLGRVWQVFSSILGSIAGFFGYLASFVTWNRSREVEVNSGASSRGEGRKEEEDFSVKEQMKKAKERVVADNGLERPDLSSGGKEKEVAASSMQLHFPKEGPPLSAEIEDIRNWVTTDYKFNGYGVSSPAFPKKEFVPESCLFYHAVDGRMVHKKPVVWNEVRHQWESKNIAGIGYVTNLHAWNEGGFPIQVPDSIIRPEVRLPEGKSFDEFNGMRQLVQKGAVSEKGIEPEQALRAALFLSGMTIEATMPYRSDVMLRVRDQEPSFIHYIFQSGLNFTGPGGGGIPIPADSIEATASKIGEHSRLNARAALSAAIRNKSHVLVFNLGIGTGFFGGDYGAEVKQGNVEGICAAAREARESGHAIQIVVPNVGLSEEQQASLTSVGIEIIAGDKDAVVALFAIQGYKVSSSIAGDPMAMLGIHGPGFWWESAGSASDEERAAYLSPCYLLGHIPINVYEYGSKKPNQIRALSEYMQASELPPPDAAAH